MCKSIFRTYAVTLFIAMMVCHASVTHPKDIGLTHYDEETNHRGHRGHGEIRGKREFLDKFYIHGTATLR
ncbi:MAG: hypothetical protein Fur006_24640 [Coleofasciculaceae cyanobacterium]